MPATSEKQRKAAGAALAALRGDTPKSSLFGAAKRMAENMTESQLADFAKKNPKSRPHSKKKGKKAKKAVKK
jgi:hypothetical protein